jgi:futalosine hydrolase
MRRILFAAAEQEELVCAQHVCKLLEKEAVGKCEFNFILTGIGATSACYTILKAVLEAKFNKKPYDLVINIGIAGSYDAEEKFSNGTAVLVEKEHFADLGFETLFGFQTLFQTETLDANAFPFKNGALERVLFDQETEKMLASNFKFGIGVTVQTITGSKQRTDELKTLFHANIESMEGASAFYVCLMEHLPFMEIRTVSNAVGESDRSKWDAAKALSSLKNSVHIICNYYISLRETN